MHLALALLACAVPAAPAASAHAAPPIGDGDGGFTLTEVGEFDRPIHADDAPGTKGNLYVVESEGRIRVLSGGTVRPQAFLDISDLVRCCGEEGLFSVAFHPAYKRNRLFYVYFNDLEGDLRVMEFKRKPKKEFVAMRASGRTVLRIPHPENSNHNGGTIAFGPDGYLYIAPGDGGSGGDPPNNAQNTKQLLGKLLRIDPRKSCTQVTKKRRPKRCKGKRRRPYSVPRGNPLLHVDASRPELYAMGLRNPFRFTFDSVTGAIAVGDVGQGCREEIDFRNRGAARGVNFGWSGHEGTRVFDSDRIAPGAVFPILEYDNSNAAPGCALGTAFEGVSVIAGQVVRDERLTSQYGRLLYSDAGNPQIRSLIPFQAGAADDQHTGVSVPGSVYSFAEGFGRQLYVVSGDGPVYRIDPA